MAGTISKISPMGRLSRSSDIVLAVAVIAIIMMIVIPLPSILLDVLIIFSITLAIVTLLIAMYTTEPLEFSVFPSIIIISVVYRLALNVSVTRSILSKAEAGNVVNAFGSFVVADNYVVGFIIFAIIMLVNFLVVAYGAVRIGEVAARFTLDSMPGKQMAIDADLNAGAITDEQARLRRKNIEQEADFFGAMDGAARFVQRDAMAGLIIVIINVFGGFIIGMVQHKMVWEEALRTYTKLSVGEGLIASLPALLMSTATGIMVTNTVSEKNLGQTLILQYLSRPKVVIIASVMLLFFGLIPGLPKLPFLFLAAAGFIVSRFLQQGLQFEEEIKKEEEKKITSTRPPESVIPLLHVDPLEVEIGYGLIPLVDVETGGDLLDRITMLRRQIALDLGMVIPPIRIRDNMQLKPNVYAMKVKGVEVARGEIIYDHYLAIPPPVELSEKIEGVETREPAFGLQAIWISSYQKERAEVLGYTVVDASSVIITHLAEIIKRNCAEILTRQDVQTLIDNIKGQHPQVIEELIPNQMTVGGVQKILQNLLKERISVRDMVTILETLADFAPTTKDIDVLTEYTRASLSRTICKQYQTPEGKIIVMTMEPKLEQKIADAQQTSSQGSYLIFEPELGQKLLKAIAENMEKMALLGHLPLLLTSAKIRLPLRRFTERVLPNLVILSYNEIQPNIPLEAVAMVSVE